MMEAHPQLAPVDGTSPALLELGRDLAKACLKRAAEIGRQPSDAASDLKVRPPKVSPPPRPSPPKSRPADHRDRSIIASLREQAELRWDLCSALTGEPKARFVARHLILDALRLVAPDERRQFVDRAIQWVEYFEGKREPPAAGRLSPDIARPELFNLGDGASLERTEIERLRRPLRKSSLSRAATISRP
jgi:hypothetical protein